MFLFPKRPATLAHYKLPVWKALHVHPDSTAASLLQDASAFSSPSLVGILLDTADAQARGGTGKAFDWSVAKALSHELSFVSCVSVSVAACLSLSLSLSLSLF
jgi:phosphoribosylanthranilate isomerase